MSRNKNENFSKTIYEKLNKLSDLDKSRLRRTNDPLHDTRVFDILGGLDYDLPNWAKERMDLIAYFYSIAYQCEETDKKEFDFGKLLKKEELSEIRFKALLSTDFDNLLFRFRQVFRFLNSKRALLNWEKIIDAVLHWDNPEKYIQKRWAEGYFANLTENNIGV